jgi:hypothetical protein
MKNVHLKNEPPTFGNVLLSAGDFIKTKWDWWAEIKEINEIKHGQGLSVRRLNDNKVLSISTDDVIEFNHACRQPPANRVFITGRG